MGHICDIRTELALVQWSPLSIYRQGVTTTVSILLFPKRLFNQHSLLIVLFLDDISTQKQRVHHHPVSTTALGRVRSGGGPQLQTAAYQRKPQ